MICRHPGPSDMPSMRYIPLPQNVVKKKKTCPKNCQEHIATFWRPNLRHPHYCSISIDGKRASTPRAKVEDLGFSNTRKTSGGKQWALVKWESCGLGFHSGICSLWMCVMLFNSMIVLVEPMSHNDSLSIFRHCGHDVGILILEFFGICWLSTWKHVDFQVFSPVYKLRPLTQ